MSLVISWAVIITVALLLLILLRNFIKRLIFLIILVAIAFFIYGLFSPSRASNAWYSVKSFPQRLSSFIDKNVLGNTVDDISLPEINILPSDPSPEIPEPTVNIIPPATDQNESATEKSGSTAEIFDVRNNSRSLLRQVIREASPATTDTSFPPHLEIPEGDWLRDEATASTSTGSTAEMGTGGDTGTGELAGNGNGTGTLISTGSASTSSAGSSASTNTTPQTLTTQEIRETERLFGLLLG